MTKREFAEEVAMSVNGEVREIEKNGVTFTGVVVNLGKVISPCIYIDEPYNNENTIQEVVDMINNTIEHVKTVDIDVNKYADYENARDKIKVRLYNIEHAGDVCEMGTNYGFKDLALVPYIDGVEVDGDKGSIRVTKEILNLWEMTEREVVSQGVKNLKYRIESMSKMFGFPEGAFPMMVVTNDDFFYGASSVIPATRELREMFPDGYIVLPSSVHEVIVIPKTEDNDINYFIDMVKTINATVLEPQDKLSDNAYEF